MYADVSQLFVVADVDVCDFIAVTIQHFEILVLFDVEFCKLVVIDEQPFQFRVFADVELRACLLSLTKGGGCSIM
jgi:hypothetical protein